MGSKVATITLAYGVHNPNDATGKDFLYRVEKITDSVDFSPRDILTKKQVEQLCMDRTWKVTIIPLGTKD